MRGFAAKTRLKTLEALLNGLNIHSIPSLLSSWLNRHSGYQNNTYELGFRWLSFHYFDWVLPVERFCRLRDLQSRQVLPSGSDLPVLPRTHSCKLEEFFFIGVGRDEASTSSVNFGFLFRSCQNRWRQTSKARGSRVLASGSSPSPYNFGIFVDCSCYFALVYELL